MDIVKIRTVLAIWTFVFCITSVIGNVYSNRKMYVTQSFRDNVQRTIQTASSGVQTTLKKVKNVPTAKWITSKGHILNPLNKGDKSTMMGILKDASKSTKTPTVTMVVYSLPNRDCSGQASAGGINTLKEYNSDFIDPIAKIAQKFCRTVPMAFIVEPDALANAVTNANQGFCSQTILNGYRSGIKYAVNKIKDSCGKAAIYIDAAHGGWLGWEDNSRKYANEIAALGVFTKIRGFATNVAGYNILGTKCPSPGFCNGGINASHNCCKTDPCRLTATYNPGFTELNYIEQLRKTLKEVLPKFEPHFVIDTSRNSNRNGVSHCSTWCNPRDVGFGIFPTTKTASPSVIDAYLWVKIPGESDGCSSVLPSGIQCSRYASACGQMESMGSRVGEQRAPQAGEWYPAQIKAFSHLRQYEF